MLKVFRSCPTPCGSLHGRRRDQRREAGAVQLSPVFSVVVWPHVLIWDRFISGTVHAVFPRRHPLLACTAEGGATLAGRGRVRFAGLGTAAVPMLWSRRPSRKAAQHGSHLLTRVPGELIAESPQVAMSPFCFAFSYQHMHAEQFLERFFQAACPAPTPGSQS